MPNPSDELLDPNAVDSTDVPEMPKALHQTVSMILSREEVTGASILIEKLNSEHIARILESSAKEDERSFAAYKLDKFVGIGVFIVSIAFVLTVLIVFKDSPHFTTILTGVFSFLGGLGVGKFILPRNKP